MSKKVKDITWDIYKVKSTYDSALDDFLLDAIERTGMTVKLSDKTSNEQVMGEMQMSKRNYKAFISKNEIFICHRKTNEPCYCLRKLAG
ncbi:MAG: hypothetical protein EBS89_07495 [Proteobacteria bacterium]|nr:hypothetical protein [Pseudomonadota bacterium]